MSVRVSFAANLGTFILFPPGSSTAYCAGVSAPWRRVPAGSWEEREREFEPKHNILHWKPNNFGSKPTKTTKKTIRYSTENGKLQTRLQNGKH